jgi:hypothetical protein
MLFHLIMPYQSTIEKAKLRLLLGSVPQTALKELFSILILTFQW